MPLMSSGSTELKLVTVQCLLAGWPSPRDWSHAIVGLMAIAILGVVIFMLNSRYGLITF